MADELEPVTQQFIADLGDYIEPIENASDETEGFADVVEQAKESLSGLRDAGAETGGSVDSLAASEDDATASTDAFAESVASMRDKVYEAYPGIDEATAALLAESAAADEAGLSNDAYAASLAAVNAQGDGLYATLAQLKDILGAIETGGSVTVGAYGLNQFFIDAEDGADDTKRAFTGLRTDADLLDDAMLRTANSTRDFWEAVNALNPELAYSENIAKDARSALRAMGATEQEAAAGAQALVKAQRDWDAAGGGGTGGLLGAIAQFFGGSGEEGFSAGGLLANVGSLTAGLGVAAAIYAAAAGITGLVAGIGATILGVGSFVALAVPGFLKVKDAIGDTRKELAKLSPDERGAVLDIRGLKTEYEDMAKAFEPDVFKVFNAGLKVTKDLLPGLQEPAQVTAGVLTKLLDQLGGLLTPKAVKGFDDLIDPYIKSALPAFAHGIGELAGSFEHLLKTMSPKDVGDDIRDFFGFLSLMVRGVAHAVRQIMIGWDDLRDAYKNVLTWTHDFVRDVEHDWDAVSKYTDKTWHDVANTVSDNIDAARETVIRVGHDIEHDWDSTWSAVVSFTRGVPHKILSALGDLGGLLVHAGEEMMGGFLHGIESGFDDVKNFISGVAGWISAHKGPIEDDAQLLRPHGQAIMHSLVTGLRDGLPELQAILGLTTGMITGLGGHASGAGGRINVTVPLTAVFGAGAGSLATDPQFLHFVQQQVQEAVLRYQTLNPGNGLTRIVPGVRTA